MTFDEFMAEPKKAGGSISFEEFMAEPAGDPPSEFPNPASVADGSVETISGRPLSPDRTALQEAGDYGQALIAGANRLVPGLLGIPVDTVTNLRNLSSAIPGIAEQWVTGKTTERPIIDPATQFGGSASFQRGLTSASQAMGLGDPFALADPNDRTQQNLSMAGTVLASGMVNPAKVPQQIAAGSGRFGVPMAQARQAVANVAPVASNVRAMAVPAAGAVAGREIAPDNELAPLMGMVAAPAGVAGLKQAFAASPKEAFIKANKLGYKVPPSAINGSKTQDFLSGAAGNVPLRQKASVYNQKLTNDFAKQELNYPKDMHLSPEGLADIRRTAGSVYEKAKNAGTFSSDQKYLSELSAIADKGGVLAKEFPGMVKKPITDQVEIFNKPQVSAEALVEAVKQLRADSSAGFKSQDPGTLALARANGKIANALEGLMERGIEKTNPALLPELRAARQTIAKTYTVEKSLKGGDVDAVYLGRQLDKGKPMSGKLRDIAEFGQNFKQFAQVSPPQSTNFRPADMIAGMGGAAAFQNPKILAVMFARPATRAILLSGRYQKMLAKVPPDKLARLANLPKQITPAGLVEVLNEMESEVE